ncbi:hypothetical protein [Cellulomonas endometrii]|uniref:hypothetical protein n=1 Tax=Cellulomonas endometrii TaxID=3036301 RepID=UPI0024AD9FE8|nr:hypothetical protein [Cellulomonas endometrii]
MRVGIYVDGFNLYYGARGLCGRGTPGWRWLDLRALGRRLVEARSGWQAARVTRVVHCTARISGADNPGGQRDQDVYLRALRASGSVDELSMGTYVTRVATAPLAVEGRRGRPELTRPQWPLMVRDGTGTPVPDAVFMASIARREEKGSDVNVASHLLIDVLSGAVDAAVVVSNDSARVPTGGTSWLRRTCSPPSSRAPSGGSRGRPRGDVRGGRCAACAHGVPADRLTAYRPPPLGAGFLVPGVTSSTPAQELHTGAQRS